MARLGRVKNIRVPSGKEHEYDEDQQGNLIHKQYGIDEEIDAVVVPSARGLDRFGTGGQHGKQFDPLGRDLKQNIIVFAEDGVQQVTEVTGRALSAAVPRVEPVRDAKGIARLVAPKNAPELSEAEAEQLGMSAEEQYRSMITKRAVAPAAPVTAPAEQTVSAIEEDLVPAPKKAKKSRRVVKSAEAQAVEAQPQQEAPECQPVLVDIEAPFGRLRQQFSGIFRDGICLVLYTDQRRIPSVYSLPAVEDPMSIVIRWQDKVVSCLWAGIQFTMPHVPISFTVLLVNEEPGE